MQPLLPQTISEHFHYFKNTSWVFKLSLPPPILLLPYKPY